MRSSRPKLPCPVVLLILITVAAVLLTGRARRSFAKEVGPSKLNKPLIAHWTFDEQFGVTCRDSSGNGCDAAPERKESPGFERIQGVFGDALSFSGNHLLRIPDKPEFGVLKQISVSAWVMPTELGEYREIFRKEDSGNRVLFSFQNNGSLLSLGLNINGYVECDAPTKPEQLLDGKWHHCAATFDGKFMRVYMDGREIGSMERPGVLAAGGAAPGCIGSSSGGENFQGAMDDLCLYAEALSAEEIEGIYRSGTESLVRGNEDLDAGEPKMGSSLLAHWRFNEPGSGGTIHEASGTPGLEIRASSPVPRRRGVFGKALDLRGTHGLEANLGPRLGEVSKITFSAWTKPSDLSGYREIFRQECGDRLLFSFQEGGSILSLGLNVGGYVECDAKIDASQVLDGRWHHCAGTFDGEFMRVYLDGKEIGQLERPGNLAVEPAAPGFIGSSSGTGEHFQGALDDLRIYGEALSPAQIASLYGSGVESLEGYAREIEKRIDTVYSPKKSFAEALALCRRNLAETTANLDRDLVEGIVSKLRDSFPEDYANFTHSTGREVVEYLTEQESDLQLRDAGRLMDLLLEYKPLTEDQLKKETAAERKRWDEAEAIHQRFENLKARGDKAEFSPEWIDLMLEAGKRIQFRPVINEAVAPYVRPQTPTTRSLSRAEARATLERDWLHQANSNPTPQRIKDEIKWTRQLAKRIALAFPGQVNLAEELQQLNELEKQTASLAAPDPELYFRAREVKRRVAFKNPVVDFDKVLFVDMPFPQGSEWRHQTRHRLGYMAVPGGRLLTLDGLSPEGKLKQLMPQLPLHGSFWRPDLSFDAKKVLFCFKPHNEKSFHLYEISVEGTGLTQLTEGPYDDFDPIYLPDDKHILFSTTRGHTYVRCMPPTNAFILARCDRDGKNLYLVSQNNEPDYLPSVMDNGKILYTRWEYNDKPLWRAQALWTVNPDGTNVSAFWGNQSVWPDLLKDARSIPGSQRVMFTGSAHHDWFSGSIGLLDPGKGFNFPDGLTKVTADMPWPESGNGPVDPIECRDYHSSGSYSAYYSPYPLSEQDFLVSAERNGKFVLYLMDVRGNRELIYEGTSNILHAIPLKPRQKPQVLPDRVDWPKREERLKPKEGVLFSGNVYQGAPPELQGKARYLRVLQIDAKTYTYWYKRPYISTGPVVSAVQSEGVKRVLGTVPIEKDGSVALYVPPGKALHFQLLDDRYRALQTMRSFVGVMPGEHRGCLGCHESHSRAPVNGLKGIALNRAPSKITPPPWGEDTVGYQRYVRPVLDKYCGSCHEGKGEAVKTLDLTDKPAFLDFTEPYLQLIGRPTWGAPYEKPKNPTPGFGIADTILVEAYSTTDPAAYKTPKPMTYLSYRSRLINLASSGRHHGVQVDSVSLQKLMAWVDTMCPYCGDEEIRQIPDPDFQGVDWLAVRPKIQTAPRIIRPGPVD